MLKHILIFMIKFLTKHRGFFFLGVFASLAVTFNACTDVDNSLGDDLLQGSEAVKDTTVLVDPSTVLTEKFPTSLSGKCYLGIYKDPVFGEISSSLVTMFLPSNISQYADTVHAVKQIVSVDLSLKLKGGVGDSLSRHTLNVFQLNEILKVDSTYYSDYKIADKKVPDAISNAEVEYDRKADGIVTIPLKTAFASSLLNGETIKQFYKAVKADSKTSLQQQFINQFKGLYVENTSTSSALGGLNAIDFADTSTRVLVRYKVTSTKGEDSLVRLSLKIGNLNRFNVVKHSYNGELKPTSDPKVIASTNPEHNGFGFLQGFGGLRTRLKFDDKTIKAFAGKGYKIHRAELVVEPYFPGGLLNYKNMPMSLSAYYPKTEKGKEIMLFTPDMEIFKEVSTNAFYNRSQRLYSLNITTFFKDAMRGVKPNEFYLYAGVPAGLYSSQSSSYGTNYAELPSDFLSLPNQVILKGQMKLIITYSK